MRIKAYVSQDVSESVFAFAKGECARYEHLFSAFEEHSDIGRLNAARGEWTPIADDTYELLTASIGYCGRSRGLFDITVKPLVDLWDVHRGVVPDEQSIEEARTHVDYRNLELMRNADGAFARLKDPAAAVDVGGTAKGFIADRLCDALVERGVASFIVSLGGNVAARGVKPDGAPFVVGVRDPNDHGRIVGTLELRDASAVASGVTERYFEKDGVRYSHLIDPRTGYPVITDLRSATLVARKSADCDGYSTTVCMLGCEAGSRFFENVEALDMAVLARADGKVKTCLRRGATFRESGA